MTLTDCLSTLPLSSSRYNSVPPRSGSSAGGNNGLSASPVSSANAKFKYAINASAAVASAAEQPVNLAMGSPSATSSPISSPQSGMPPGMDKLTYADFMYNRHAVSFLAPQGYSPLMYPGQGGGPPNGMPAYGSLAPPSPQSMKQQHQEQQRGKGEMSPPVMDRNGGHLTADALLSNHRYQHQQQQQAFHHQQQLAQQKSLKGSAAGFILPPAQSMIPTQADLEALHAYHEMGSRLFYNGHGPAGPPPPPPEHLLSGQRMHQSPLQQQQSRSQPQQHPSGKRAIGDQGLYAPQSPHHANHRVQQQQKQPPSPQDKNNNFKVPSGKEGALKHRGGGKGGKGRGGSGKQNGMKASNGGSGSNSR